MGNKIVFTFSPFFIFEECSGKKTSTLASTKDLTMAELCPVKISTPEPSNLAFKNCALEPRTV